MGTWNQFNSFFTLINGDFGQGFAVQQVAATNNIGVGTFVHGDGELIIMDDEVYQIRNNNKVIKLNPNDTITKIPFASCAKFRPTDIIKITGPIQPWKNVLERLEQTVCGKNCVIVLRAKFANVKLRSFNKVLPPYPKLEKWEENQTVTHYQNIAMDCAIFKSFKSFEGQLSLAWHGHCINKNQEVGGHILDAALTEGVAEIMYIDKINFHNLS